MILIEQNEWIQLRGEFLKTEYLKYKEIPKFTLNKDEKLAIKLNKTNTLDCPLERINPTVLAMIFSLYDKIEPLAGKEIYNQVESLKFELQTVKSYMNEILEMKEEFSRIKKLFLFENKEKEIMEELPSIEIYDLEQSETSSQ